VVGSNGIVGYHGEFKACGPGVFVGRSGSVGKVSRVQTDYWPLNTTLWVRDFHGNDPSFVYYLLSGIDFRRYASGVSVPTLNRNLVHPIEVIVPPLHEQKSIAQSLDSITQAYTATERVIRAARELKFSLMRYLFTYGPVPVDQAEEIALKETDAGSPMPSHWQLKQLGDVAKIERGKFSHRPRNDPAFYGGHVPFIQTGEITEAAARDGYVRTYSQTLNDRGLSVSRLFPKGTLAITIAANIGFTAILDFDSAFPDSIIAISPEVSTLSSEYLNYYLATQQAAMDRLAPRGTQKNINIQFLRPWPIKVPPPDEQQRIINALGALDRKIQAEAKRLEALEQLLSASLRELMTGRRLTLRPGSQ
jgi:type I restriction enzyme S subunit